MGEKEMKKIGKITTIFVVLLMLAIPFSIVQASETTQTNSENISIEIAAYEEDGTITTQSLTMTNEELTEFENAITQIMNNIHSVEDWDNIQDLIEENLGGKHPLIGIVTGFILKFKNLFNRALVISSGHGLKLNPFKRNEFKIRKTLSMWHYSSNGQIQDRTIILRPLKLKMKILKGTQIGLMTKFTGIYIYISRTLPEKSYTFFLGTAKRITGIQLPSISR